MLGCFLKNNKQVYKAFKKHQQENGAKHDKVEVSGKKRKRSTSQADEESPKKRKRVSSVASTEGPITRRKSHDIAEAAENQKVEAVKFQRIDTSKFTSIQNHFADNSFAAKAKFG